MRVLSRKYRGTKSTAFRGGPTGQSIKEEGFKEMYLCDNTSDGIIEFKQAFQKSGLLREGDKKRSNQSDEGGA
jgi:hypothetical protein